MRAVGALVSMLVAASCGAAKVAPPDAIERELPAKGDAPQRDGSVVLEDDEPDASVADAGQCCLVRFALGWREGEQTAQWVAPPDLRIDMTLDAGAWQATVCLNPELTRGYFYETTLAPEEPDAGGFVVARINEGAPSDVGGAVNTVNVFDAMGVTHCEALDAGVHGRPSP